MTAVVPLELTGLRGDHPLGFLAACGLLRVLNEHFPARLGWKKSEQGGQWFAFLERDTSTSEAEDLRERLVKIIALAAKQHAEMLARFQISETEAPSNDFQDWAKRSLERRCSDRTSSAWLIHFLPGVGTDILQKKKDSGKNKGKFVIRSTHFAMTSGQQNLIASSNKIASKLALESNGEVPDHSRRRITEALFGPWTYQDEEHSLGFDPSSQRLHALRGMAPTNESNKGSVSAAVFLALQAMPLFPCLVSQGRLRTTGFHRENGEDWFSWPVWRTPITLDTVRSLIVHPFTEDLKKRGVDIVYRCRRVRTGGAEGNYQVFSHASERPWRANDSANS